MNFLAHAFLAGDGSALIVGGVAGDWVKGLLPGPLSEDLARGVALHRAIDSFSDTHPAFRRSRERMSPERRRYAGVLVDMFYDHLLARDWGLFHDAPLGAYCEDVYAQVRARLHELPPASHGALELMARQNWLLSYSSLAGIADVLARMSRRARQPNPLAGGEEEFLAECPGFEEDFLNWFPDARSFAQEWVASR